MKKILFTALVLTLGVIALFSGFVAVYLLSIPLSVIPYALITK